MVTHDEAVALASALPNVTEGTTYGNRAWKVGAKVFAWDRRTRRTRRSSWGFVSADRPNPHAQTAGAGRCS
jgi:hypothetical protein